MLSGPFVISEPPPSDTRTFWASGAMTRNVTLLSGFMHGYLASGIFKMLGLQSSATCPQHNQPPNTAKINADFRSDAERHAVVRIYARIFSFRNIQDVGLAIVCHLPPT